VVVAPTRRDRRCRRHPRGERPEHLTYEGSAESLQEVWIALRAGIRGVLEQVTLADIAARRLPRRVRELARSPAAWTSG
jgi:DNA-binding IscR family transcriptional regulator